MNAGITRSLRRAAVFAFLFAFAALLPSQIAAAKPPGPPPPSGNLGAPTLVPVGATQTTIDIKFVAGTGGAPAGFTLQWALESDYILAGNKWPSTDCEQSFGGVPTGSPFSLPNAGDSITLTVPTFPGQIGATGFDPPGPPCNAPLVCGTAYVFRAFSHNDPHGLNKSDFSAVVEASTLPCSTGCTLTQGYWKNHGPIPSGHNSNTWKLTIITLGIVPYSDFEALMILNTPPMGNGLVILAHQLIAAKLSIANGANPTPAVTAAINAADVLIGNLMVPPIGFDYIDPSVAGPLADILDVWLNANDCSNPTPQ